MSNLREIKVKFTDSEFGDRLAYIAYNPAKHNFEDTMNLASIILYNLEDYSYEELKKEFNLYSLDMEVYETAARILDNGNTDVTTQKFLEFLNEAFGWEIEYINPLYTYDITNGHFVNEDN